MELSRINLKLARGTFDVNVTPDKREIFLTEVRCVARLDARFFHSILLHPQEASIVTGLKEALHRLWEPSRSTFLVQQPLSSYCAAVGKPLTAPDQNLEVATKENSSDAASAKDAEATGKYSSLLSSPHMPLSSSIFRRKGKQKHFRPYALATRACAKSGQLAEASRLLARIDVRSLPAGRASP